MNKQQTILVLLICGLLFYAYVWIFIGHIQRGLREVHAQIKRLSQQLDRLRGKIT